MDLSPTSDLSDDDTAALAARYPDRIARLTLRVSDNALTLDAGLPSPPQPAQPEVDLGL